MSDTTSRVISLMRDCAASMTARRSLSLPRLSPVVCAWASSPAPSRAPTESSRSATTRARSVCRDPSHSDIPPIRPPSSALDCASAAKRASIASCRSSAISRSRRRAAPARHSAIKLSARERSQQRQSPAKRLGERDRDAGDDSDGAGGHLRLAEALCVMAARTMIRGCPGHRRRRLSPRLEDPQASCNTRRDPIRHPSAQSLAPNRSDGRDKPGSMAARLLANRLGTK